MANATRNPWKLAMIGLLLMVATALAAGLEIALNEEFSTATQGPQEGPVSEEKE